jgi:pyruvate kinase
MNWGVAAILYKGESDDEARIRFAAEFVKQAGFAHAGDTFIVTAGQAQRSGGTDMIRVITL